MEMFKTVEWNTHYGSRDEVIGYSLGEYDKFDTLSEAVQSAKEINDSYYEHDVKVEYWPAGATECAWRKSPYDLAPAIPEPFDMEIPF
jgi:hypothetical protein